MKNLLLLLFLAVLSCTKATDEPIVPEEPIGKIDIINNSDYAVTIQTVEGAKDFKPTRMTAKSTITVPMLTELNFDTKITISVSAAQVGWRYRFKEGFANSRSTFTLDLAEYSVEYFIDGTMPDAKISYQNDKGGRDSFDLVKLPFKLQYKAYQNSIASLSGYSNYRDGNIKARIYYFGKLVQQAESTGSFPNVFVIHADL